MFADFHIEADRRMSEYGREAEQALTDNAIEQASTTTGSTRRGVRFPLPEWMKHPGLVLRNSSR